MPVFQQFQIASRTFEILFMCNVCGAEVSAQASKAELLAADRPGGRPLETILLDRTPEGWQISMPSGLTRAFPNETIALCPACALKEQIP